MKKIGKIGLILLIVAFLGLYFSYRNGFYERMNETKKILTEEMIQEYEEDLKNGVDTSKKQYIIEVPHYDNSYTRFFLKLSHMIENSFDKTIKYFFRKISNYLNE